LNYFLLVIKKRGVMTDLLQSMGEEMAVKVNFIETKSGNVEVAVMSDEKIFGIKIFSTKAKILAYIFSNFVHNSDSEVKIEVDEWNNIRDKVMNLNLEDGGTKPSLNICQCKKHLKVRAFIGEIPLVWRSFEFLLIFLKFSNDIGLFTSDEVKSLIKEAWKSAYLEQIEDDLDIKPGKIVIEHLDVIMIIPLICGSMETLLEAIGLPLTSLEEETEEKESVFNGAFEGLPGVGFQTMKDNTIIPPGSFSSMDELVEIFPNLQGSSGGDVINRMVEIMTTDDKLKN
jgi:hypothetical protein